MTINLIFVCRENSAIIYRYRYKSSDAFDNTYINKELLTIDKKRAESGKETIIPLDMIERKHFIDPFDPIMTKIEFNRFIFGITLFSVTVGQVLVYFAADYGVYSLFYWFDTFIDVLSEIFSPAAMKIDFKSDSFIARRLNQMNEGFDVKKRIVERLQNCKSHPMKPNKELYSKIIIYLALILLTLFFSSYGLRLRHYFAGIFYPNRVHIRAVWLYNNILSRRGTIFQFWRKKMRQKVFGRAKGTEKVSFLDRLCAQWVYIRIICKILGLYGHHKYCQMCGTKVKADGSDQSVQCVHKCGAIYCFDCLGEQNNICAVCMNPIDYSELGEVSEELDSSEEDIDYELHNEDYLYQYLDETKTDEMKTEDWDDLDPGAYQRKDLVSLAYKYDTVDRVPTVVYLVDDEGYDAEDESDVSEDQIKYILDLEQELGIPAEHILQMKLKAKQYIAEDNNKWFAEESGSSVVNKCREEKYSQLKREDDQRLLKNALLMVNKDRRKNIKKSRIQFSKN